MDNRTLQELKRAYLEAEERQRDAYRRAVWLEKHLYDASTDGEFCFRLEELKAQERALQDLGYIAMIARCEYMTAEMATRSQGATV